MMFERPKTRAEETSYVYGPGSVRGAHYTHGGAGRQRGARVSTPGVWNGHSRIRLPVACSDSVACRLRHPAHGNRVPAGPGRAIVVCGRRTAPVGAAFHVGTARAPGRRTAHPRAGSRAFPDAAASAR